MIMRGSVDSLTATGAQGWIFTGGMGEDVVVQALLNGNIVGEATADIARPDLAAAGFGDGRCGFAIEFYDAVEAAKLPFVAIRPVGTDVDLPRTSLTGFGDFFRTLHTRRPGSGHHRSVFGGLWTDRADAARLLAGRVAAGATPADLEPTLRAFIDDGYAVLRSALAPVGFSAAEATLVDSLEAGRPLDPRAEYAARRLLEALPGIVFRDVPLRTLRGLLDDNPTAYRAEIARGDEARFTQPSAAEALSSPAECVMVLTCAGEDGLLLDIVRGSHALPEFTPDGRSRWLADGAAGIELAALQGMAVETVEVGPRDIAIVAAGTLYRIRTPDTAAGLSVWCSPARVTPDAFITGTVGTFTVRHHSGAKLTV
jgi:hypothetical protein